MLLCGIKKNEQSNVVMSVETHFSFSFQPLTHMFEKPVWENALLSTARKLGVVPPSLALMGEM